MRQYQVIGYAYDGRIIQMSQFEKFDDAIYNAHQNAKRSPTLIKWDLLEIKEVDGRRVVRLIASSEDGLLV